VKAVPRCHQNEQSLSVHTVSPEHPGLPSNLANCSAREHRVPYLPYTGFQTNGCFLSGAAQSIHSSSLTARPVSLIFHLLHCFGASLQLRLLPHTPQSASATGDHESFTDIGFPFPRSNPAVHRHNRERFRYSRELARQWHCRRECLRQHYRTCILCGKHSNIHRRICPPL
jgi:hypothetical protein